MKILNNGNGCVVPVLRREVTGHWRGFDLRTYQVFGPKIVAAQGLFEGRALECRCLTEEMGQTWLRREIPVNPNASHPEAALHLRNQLLLLGFSKSGWGAWSLLLRNPGRFEAAVAWDTPFMEEKAEKYGMGPAFGTPENFEKYRIAALLRTNAESLRDRKRLGHLGYGNFRGHHRKLQALLEELRIPVEHRDGPKRPHAWDGGWLEEAAGVLAGLGG